LFQFQQFYPNFANFANHSTQKHHKQVLMIKPLPSLKINKNLLMIAPKKADSFEFVKAV